MFPFIYPGNLQTNCQWKCSHFYVLYFQPGAGKRYICKLWSCKHETQLTHSDLRIPAFRIICIDVRTFSWALIWKDWTWIRRQCNGSEQSCWGPTWFHWIFSAFLEVPIPNSVPRWGTFLPDWVLLPWTRACPVKDMRNPDQSDQKCLTTMWQQCLIPKLCRIACIDCSTLRVSDQHACTTE